MSARSTDDPDPITTPKDLPDSARGVIASVPCEAGEPSSPAISSIRFSRIWAMPSADTFSILPIRHLLARHINKGMVVVDPCARNSMVGTIRNDLDPATLAEFHIDSRSFLLWCDQGGIRADAVLFDPPYSPRQISEHYKAIGRKVTAEDTQNSRFCKENKDALDRILVVGGVAIICGWNSVGMGIGRGYRLEEVLLISHGEGHNDTIVTVERKMQGRLL